VIQQLYLLVSIKNFLINDQKISKAQKGKQQMDIELDTETPTNLSSDQEFLQRLQNFMQTEEAQQQIHPFLKKAFVVYSTVFDIQGKSQKQKLKTLDQLQDPSSELTQLLKQNICLCSDKTLVLNNQKLLLSIYTSVTSPTSQKANDQAFTVPMLCSPCPPKLTIDLPDNYQEFQEKLMFQKCNQCKNYSNKGDMLLCLLCGEIMCFNHCTKTMYSYPPGKHKNGQGHALKHHNGNTIYVGMYKNDYYVSFQGRGLYWNGDVYKGKYGQTMLNHRIGDYRTIKLDRQLLNKLVDGLKTQKFSQMCYYQHVKLHGSGQRQLFNN